MVIWGTRAVKRTLQTGTFMCPNCQTVQNFRLVRAQKHGHLYWIPLFSMGAPVQYVECQACKGTYDPAVLSASVAPSQAALVAKYQEGIVRVMVSMMLADGDVRDSEVQGIQDVFRSMTQQELSRADIDAVVAAVRRQGVSLESYLADLEPYLSNDGKEAIVKAALIVAASDGDFGAEEAGLVGRIGAALELSNAHLRGIVAEMMPTQA